MGWWKPACAVALWCVVSVGCSARDPEKASAAQVDATGPGRTRTYYVAADDVVWDYAPSGLNKVTGQPFEGDAAYAAAPSPIGLGRVYKKSVFREYTDATFTTLKPRETQW